MKLLNLILFSLFFISKLSAQSINVSGYVYDELEAHRVDEARINVYKDGFLLSNFIETDRNGSFEVQLPVDGTYRFEIIRTAYQRTNIELKTDNRKVIQLVIPINRLPGYEFIGSIKELINDAEGEYGDDIVDTRIEVYNHTNGEEELNIMVHPKGFFEFNFERGNRYSIMIRKKGYFAKRFEVLVNIDGCIVCFEGLGTESVPITYGEMTDGNKKGVLITDIPVRRIVINQAIKLDDIYYDYDKWAIRPDARAPLDKLVKVMKATPIIIELSSHTDSRGNDEYNMQLSQKRAQSAVDYIISRGVSKDRINAMGYGESILVNECDDGMACTEKEHQLNRRTEFKVTKMMTASSFDNKTLKDIIEEERRFKRKTIEILGAEK